MEKTIGILYFKVLGTTSLIMWSKSVVLYGKLCQFYKKAYSSCICNDMLYRSYKIKLLVCFIWAQFLEFQNICRKAKFIGIVSSMCVYVVYNWNSNDVITIWRYYLCIVYTYLLLVYSELPIYADKKLQSSYKAIETILCFLFPLELCIHPWSSGLHLADG